MSTIFRKHFDPPKSRKPNPVAAQNWPSKVILNIIFQSKFLVWTEFCCSAYSKSLLCVAYYKL